MRHSQADTGRRSTGSAFDLLDSAHFEASPADKLVCFNMLWSLAHLL